MPKCYALDIDDTMETSGGPVTVQSLRDLHADGHIVGLCGGNIRFLERCPDWHTFISFTLNMDFGHPATLGHQYGMGLIPKRFWLHCWKHATLTTCEDYIMVGNAWGNCDNVEAAAAGWRFISETDFAKGQR